MPQITSSLEQVVDCFQLSASAGHRQKVFPANSMGHPKLCYLVGGLIDRLLAEGKVSRAASLGIVALVDWRKGGALRIKQRPRKSQRYERYQIVGAALADPVLGQRIRERRIV